MVVVAHVHLKDLSICVTIFEKLYLKFDVHVFTLALNTAALLCRRNR